MDLLSGDGLISRKKVHFSIFLCESEGNGIVLEAKTALHVVIQIVMASRRDDCISMLAKWLLYRLNVLLMLSFEIVFFSRGLNICLVKSDHNTRDSSANCD